MSTPEDTPVERSQRARHPPNHLNVYDAAQDTPSDAGSVPSRSPLSPVRTPIIIELDSTPDSEVEEVEVEESEVEEIEVAVTTAGVGKWPRRREAQDIEGVCSGGVGWSIPMSCAT